tara:strand:+ start:616 stop:1284 length:669 start_codon:yes stop_codon:yes gene_type:complete
MKIVEYHDKEKFKDDFKTNYLRYRLGRIRHEIWLKNRKQKRKLLDKYDNLILENCKSGKITYFNSAGYYIADLYPDKNIEVIENDPIVKKFYPKCITANRQNTGLDLTDNFIVTNCRSDHWNTLEGFTEHFKKYTSYMKPGCRFFYSMRDTQLLGINRFKENVEQKIINWAHSLKHIQLTLVMFKIEIPKRQSMDTKENPDTANGNIKLAFVYDGEPWSVKC